MMVYNGPPEAAKEFVARLLTYLAQTGRKVILEHANNGLTITFENHDGTTHEVKILDTLLMAGAGPDCSKRFLEDAFKEPMQTEPFFGWDAHNAGKESGWLPDLTGTPLGPQWVARREPSTAHQPEQR